jgi:GntR family transcriptional regulator
MTLENHKLITDGINPQIHTPLYYQIFLILRNKILDGTYPPNSLIPNEVQIMEMFNVSRITAKRALNDLAAANYVIRKRGKGTRVCDKLPVIPLDIPSDDLIENLYQIGMKTQVEILSFAYIAATPNIAINLGVEENDIVQSAVRIRSYHGKPYSHVTSFVPEAIGQTYTKKDLGNTPLFQLIQRRGTLITRAEHKVSAILADPTVAPLLDVEVGSPLLKVDKVIFDQNNRPVEYLNVLYRSDRYNYKVSLSVSRSNDAWTHADNPGNSEVQNGDV